MLSIFEKPNLLLKLEGLAVFLLALALYWQQSFSWPLFWSTVLLPDIAILGYLVNAKLGARMYNITHAKLLPSVLAVVGIATGNSLCTALAVIWFVHIGMDRMLGYTPKGLRSRILAPLGR